jgi:8-oxo-dGTP pyrophosphatase MutT (NUDIX family)
MIDINKNPWKILSSDIKYTNPWIEVTEHKVLNPSGNKGIYGTVHFKNIAIGILAINEKDELILVGQYRFPLNKYSWEIPEGGGNPSIDTLISAQRELLEETGLKAAKWTKLLDIHTSNSVSDEVGIVYLAEELTLFDAEPEETEELQLKTVTLKEAVQMVMDGAITDSISMAAILKLQLLRVKNL